MTSNIAMAGVGRHRSGTSLRRRTGGFIALVTAATAAGATVISIAWSASAASGATVPTSWRSVDTGSVHACAVADDGALWCWGANAEGQLGDGATTDSKTPVRVAGETTWTDVSAGVGHTCAVRSSGTLWCWGAGQEGSLGSGGTQSSATPVQVGTQTSWATVTAGGARTCAIRSDTSLWCWGHNEYGAVGDGGRTIYQGDGKGHEVKIVDHDRLSPVKIGESGWASVTAGRSHSCGIRVDKTLWCWGSNDSGQIGDGTNSNGPGTTTDPETGKAIVTPPVDATRVTPVRIGTDATWQSVTAGDDHTCAIRTDGSLWCWGKPLYGRLGVMVEGTGSTFQTSPRQVGTATDWRSLAAGAEYTCGTRGSAAGEGTSAAGTLWCWGTDGEGQLGLDSLKLTNLVTQVGTGSWRVVSGGDEHTCGIRADRVLLCWGTDDRGQLGAFARSAI